MSSVVLDASAVLALLNDEPGAEVVAEALARGSAVGAVNLSEVAAKLAESGMPEGEVATACAALGLEVHPFDEAMAYDAAALRASTRALGLSLGDRACLALGRRLRLPVLTAERAWKGARVGVVVRLIRR